MGSIGIIARRRKDGTVQYGYAGNGAYYSRMGNMLMQWYNEPRMAAYLFSLGQLSCLDMPLSEKGYPGGTAYNVNTPTGEPHWESNTERSIFSQIAFIDHGYFYETECCQWFHVSNGPFRLKAPLKLIANNLDEDLREDGYLESLERLAIDYILNEYPTTDPEFRNLLAVHDLDGLRKDLSGSQPMEALFDNHMEIYEYLDDFIVALPDDECRNVAGFLVRKRESPRLETINWPGHPVLKKEEYTNPSIELEAADRVAEMLEDLMRAGTGTAEDLEKYVGPWFARLFIRENSGPWEFWMSSSSKGHVRLIEENAGRLCRENPEFREAYGAALARGRKSFFNYMRDEADTWQP